jgi:hypothetical protein
MLKQPPEYDEAAVDVAVIKLNEHQNKLMETKGKLWTRKVSFICAYKASSQILEPKFVIDKLNTMVVNDLLSDLCEHYPDRDPIDLQGEFIKDCDAMLDMLLVEADKALL